ACALRDRHGWREVVAVPVLVGDVLDEQHKLDVVLVLAGVHAAAELVAGCPERRVEVRFPDGHDEWVPGLASPGRSRRTAYQGALREEQQALRREWRPVHEESRAGRPGPAPLHEERPPVRRERRLAPPE